MPLKRMIMVVRTKGQFFLSQLQHSGYHQGKNEGGRFTYEGH